MKVYEKVYDFYVNQIMDGSLKPGDKLPSIRETEKTPKLDVPQPPQANGDFTGINLKSYF